MNEFMHSPIAQIRARLEACNDGLFILEDCEREKLIKKAKRNARFLLAFLFFLTDEAQDQVCHSAAGAAVQVVKELGLKGRYFFALKVAGHDGLC